MNWSRSIHFGLNPNAITFFRWRCFIQSLHLKLDWSIPYSLCRIWMEQNVCGLLIWRTPYSEPAQKPPSCPVSSPLQIARYSSHVSRIIGNEYPVLGPLGSPLTAVVASSDSSDSIDNIGDSIGDSSDNIWYWWQYWVLKTCHNIVTKVSPLWRSPPHHQAAACGEQVKYITDIVEVIHWKWWLRLSLHLFLPFSHKTTKWLKTPWCGTFMTAANVFRYLRILNGNLILVPLENLRNQSLCLPPAWPLHPAHSMCGVRGCERRVMRRAEWARQSGHNARGGHSAHQAHYTAQAAPWDPDEHGDMVYLK